MQLTLNHNDLTKALCAYLQAQGMTAFDPSVVTVEFAFKRGTKELLCTLDTDAPAPAAPVTVDPKPSAETPSETGSASAALTQEVAPAGAAVEPAPAVEPETPAPITGEAPAAGGEDDNLFD